MNDAIEFYDGDRILARVDSSIVPPVDSFISIRGRTWRVGRVTYALDHADEPSLRGMRVNVDLTLVATPKGGA